MTAPLADDAHRARLEDHARRLLDFGQQVVHPCGGAGYLDARGHVDVDRGVHTWITARMLHVQSLGILLEVPGSTELARLLLAGLAGPLHDEVHGGWHHHLGPDCVPDRTAGKSCYDHDFVLLGLSSAVVAGVPGAGELLARACDTFMEHFWDERAGRCVDRWDSAWQRCDDYRGLNANMHAVEAMLAVADATHDPRWTARAALIAELVVELAESHRGRLPEHFDSSWRTLLDLNRDRPDDPFKPYGATVGHGLEWSRLLLHLEAAQGPEASADLLATSRRLFDRAVTDGWAVDGRPGFVYTTDWSGNPVVADRMHWVAAEGIAAAAALHRRTGGVQYAEWYRTWWAHVDDVFLDHDLGSWHHQLDPHNRPATGVWSGKPDLYHALQATLLPRLPLAPSLATALATALRQDRLV